METLATQFDQAVRNVTIHGEKHDRAVAAHTEVRALLERDPELKEWGINSILIGSYARHTARYPGKDVDVFLRFENLTVRNDPARVYAAVERVLVAHYGLKGEDPKGRVTRQARSLNIDFPDADDPSGDQSFSVDAVPAVHWGDNWGIPNRDRELWNNDDSRWIRTDPVQFASDTADLSTASWSPSIGATNAYCPIVRLLRQVRHIHLGQNRPGGLFVEVAAYYAWKAREVTGSSWAELLASTLAAVSRRFATAATDGLLDPVLGTPMKPALDPAQWASASAVFADLAQKAATALESERCMSAKFWRDILGTNDRGQVLPLPDGCDAGGFPVSAISAVNAVGSDQPRGFALGFVAVR